MVIVLPSLPLPFTSAATGASFTVVTVNVALLLSFLAASDPSPVSVAVKVIVSFPCQFNGVVIVAT